MKDHHLPTPQREHLLANRGNKSTLEHVRKQPRKINKKCLDSAFASVSDDLNLQTPNASIDTSPISLLFDDNQLCESTESFSLSTNPDISLTPESAISDLTMFSTAISADKEGEVIVGDSTSAEFDGARLGSAEAEIVVKHLRQAQTQILNSSDGDPRVKKLLDALITVIVDEFYSLPEERDLIWESVSMKTYIMTLSLVLCILALAVMFLSTSSVHKSFTEPPPC